MIIVTASENLHYYKIPLQLNKLKKKVIDSTASNFNVHKRIATKTNLQINITEHL